jgi:hypothetical protein
MEGMSGTGTVRDCSQKMLQYIASLSDGATVLQLLHPYKTKVTLLSRYGLIFVRIIHVRVSSTDSSTAGSSAF